MSNVLTLWRPVGQAELDLIEASGAERFPVRRAGRRGIDELWVPAEELAEFNRHIVGTIEVVAEYR